MRTELLIKELRNRIISYVLCGRNTLNEFVDLFYKRVTPTHIEFFNSKESKKEKSKLLAAVHDKAIGWEKLSVSSHSPGVVKNTEFVSRQMFYPIHIDDDGEIKMVAFDDAFNKGLSVNRLDYAHEKDIHRLGETKAKHDRMLKPERRYVGFVKANVSELRAVSECDKRVYAIFDTAMKDVFHHADVCTIIFGPINCESINLPKKAAKMKRRREMKKIFSDIVKVK